MSIDSITCPVALRAKIAELRAIGPATLSLCESLEKRAATYEKLIAIAARDTHEHVCDPTVSPCTCGRKWDYVQTYSDGTQRFTSKDVRDKFHALYGAPERAPFVRVRKGAV